MATPQAGSYWERLSVRADDRQQGDLPPPCETFGPKDDPGPMGGFARAEGPRMLREDSASF